MSGRSRTDQTPPPRPPYPRISDGGWKYDLEECRYTGRTSLRGRCRRASHNKQNLLGPPMSETGPSGPTGPEPVILARDSRFWPTSVDHFHRIPVHKVVPQYRLVGEERGLGTGWPTWTTCWMGMGACADTCAAATWQD